MADRDDTLNLVKSGLSLFANVLDAVEKGRAGQSYGAGASAGRAASDLVSIVSTLTRRSSEAKQSTALAISASSPTLGGYRVTSKWENSEGAMGISYNPRTGYFILIAERASSDGYNFYFGAGVYQGDAWKGLMTGTNSSGHDLVCRLVQSGNALYMEIYDLDTDETGERVYSRLS